jgi:hypothetical protein
MFGGVCHGVRFRRRGVTSMLPRAAGSNDFCATTGAAQTTDAVALSPRFCGVLPDLMV